MSSRILEELHCITNVIVRMATQLVPLPEVERLSASVVRILAGNPGKVSYAYHRFPPVDSFRIRSSFIKGWLRGDINLFYFLTGLVECAIVYFAR